MGNRSRAKFETFCTSCEQLVGVWKTMFNRTNGEPERAVHSKTTRHYAPGTKTVCKGSLLSVHHTAVMPTSREKTRAN